MQTSKQHLNQATTAPLPCPEASIGNPAERAQESHPVTEEVSRDFSKIALAAELATKRRPPGSAGEAVEV